MSFDIGSAIGGIAGGYLSGKSAEKATEKQIAWERERAQNAHQWEVKDLEAAGLNPILSAGGQGAQTSPINPQTTDWGTILNQGLSNMISATKVKKENEKTQADIEKTIADKDLVLAKTLTEAEKKGLISNQTAESAFKAQLLYGQTKLAQQEFEHKADSWAIELEKKQQEIEALKAQNNFTEAKRAEQEFNNSRASYRFFVESKMNQEKYLQSQLQRALTAQEIELKKQQTEKTRNEKAPYKKKTTIKIPYLFEHSEEHREHL